MYIPMHMPRSVLKFATNKIGIVSRFRIRPGGRLNKKDDLTRYGDSHVKDKTS